MASGQFRILRCRMAGVQAVEASSHHAFPRHTHEQFGIGVIERGAQKSLSGRGTVEAGPGDTITVNPGEVHDGTPLGDEGRSWRMLYIDPWLIAQAASDIREGKGDMREFERPAFTDPRAAGLVLQLFAAATTSETVPTMALQQEECLLALLALSMRERQPTPDTWGHPPAIARARSLVDNDPARPFTLAELARESHLSRFQVVRGFTKATGLTPHAYIVQRRIHLARRLIAEGMSLAETAAAAGFADQSHMTRIFTRTYGLPPRAYAATRRDAA